MIIVITTYTTTGYEMLVSVEVAMSGQNIIDEIRE